MVYINRELDFLRALKIDASNDKFTEEEIQKANEEAVNRRDWLRYCGFLDAVESGDHKNETVGLWLDWPGGLGDNLWASSLLREVKRRWPEVVTGFSNALPPRGPVSWKDALLGHDWIDYARHIGSDPIPDKHDGKEIRWYFVSSQYCPHTRWSLEDKRSMNHMEIIEAWSGLEIQDKSTYWHVADEEKEFASRFISELGTSGKVIVMATGSTSPIRNWHLSHQEHLIQRLLTRHTVLMVDGSAKDMMSHPNLVNLTGNYNIREIAAIIDQSDYVVTMDTGILHIAGALDAKTLAIFGPTSPQSRSAYYPSVSTFWGRPVDDGGNVLKCSPCFKHQEDPFCDFAERSNDPLKHVSACMTLWGPGKVIDKISEDIGEPLFPGKKVTVIVPVHGQAHLLGQFLSSMSQTIVSPQDIDVVLVDNASEKTRELGDIYAQASATGWTVLMNRENRGYPGGCNDGAAVANSEWFIFANTDLICIQSGWIERLVSFAESKGGTKKIGGVGPLLTYPNDRIQSCGHIWDPKEFDYVHRYIGKPKKDPRARYSTKVDSITGACLLVPADYFSSKDGFDESYGLGLHEETDFLCTARSDGRDVWYCANVELRHLQSQTAGGGWPPHHVWQNKWRFRKKIVRNGLAGKAAKIVAAGIVLNGEEYIRESVLSVLPIVEKAIVVHGSVESARDFSDPATGLSIDRTGEILQEIKKAYPDKLEIIEGTWPTKTEMRNEYCNIVGEYDWLLQVDWQDEVWSCQNLMLLENAINGAPEEAECLAINCHEFFGDFLHVANGTWLQFLPKRIVFRLKDGLKFDHHTQPVKADGEQHKTASLRNIHYHHYGYVTMDDANIWRKWQYYVRRGTPGFNQIPDWYHNVWLRWKKDPVDVESTTGTHLFGGGKTEPFLHPHPEVMMDNPTFQAFMSRSGGRLNIHGSAPRIPGFVNMTWVEGAPQDVVGDWRNPPFPANSMSEIVINDVIEHIPRPGIMQYLAKLKDMLIPGGRLRLIVPNIKAVASAYVSGKVGIDVFNQWSHGSQTSNNNVHYVGFDSESIGVLLGQVGFRVGSIEERNDMHLLVEATK